jgi:hypothetical protein
MTLLVLLMGVAKAGTIVMLLSDICRQVCARGTRRRYVFATVAWGAVPFAVFDGPLSAVAHALGLYDRPTWRIAISFAISVWCIWTLATSDDDNEWRRRRRQVGRWLRSQLAQRQLVPARGGA